MNILIATSEVAPFAKTGGLADVCSALPQALTRLGHKVVVFLPAYRNVDQAGIDIVPTEHEFRIPISSKISEGRLLKAKFGDPNVDIYFVEQAEYFDRPELYRENGQDYNDNCERFIFFSRCVLDAIRLLDLDLDLIHCNDWQTGLIPAYLKIEYNKVEKYQKIASLLTIHNLAYQGSFWHWDMALTGLDWKYFNWQEMEFFDRLNLMKTGIVFADAINTVSLQYAYEIQTPEYGCGLNGVLQHRRDRLTGILNGVDYSQWSPETDPEIAENFSVDNWQKGKAACKASLQEEFGLPERPDVPLIGLIGRLAEQKGWDLIIELIQSWSPGVDVQWAILGTGEKEYEDALREISQKWPEKVGAKLSFSNRIAHILEAGADMFLMPSQYEPCGLNQLYSLKYGTVPIVHATGGLADTIVDTNRTNLANSTANGFSFSEYSYEALQTTTRVAVETFKLHPDTWRDIVETGMKQDWSWDSSAEKYVQLYQKILYDRSQEN